MLTGERVCVFGVGVVFLQLDLSLSSLRLGTISSTQLMSLVYTLNLCCRADVCVYVLAG